MAQRLKEAIAGLMHKLEGQKQDTPPDDPGSFLKKAFTKKELEHIRSSYFRNGILAIGVDSSSWLYSLSLKKEQKLSKLRDKLKIIVKDIRFFLGE
jgi:hypothetical protein